MRREKEREKSSFYALSFFLPASNQGWCGEEGWKGVRVKLRRDSKTWKIAFCRGTAQGGFGNSSDQTEGREGVVVPLVLLVLLPFLVTRARTVYRGN